MTDTNDIAEAGYKYLEALQTGDPDRQPTDGMDIVIISNMLDLIEQLQEKLKTAYQWDDIESQRNEILQQRIEELEAALNKYSEDEVLLTQQARIDELETKVQLQLNYIKRLQIESIEGKTDE